MKNETKETLELISVVIFAIFLSCLMEMFLIAQIHDNLFP